MNEEKRKALAILSIFISIVIIIPFLLIIILKPSGRDLITFSQLIHGLILIFIGITGIYAGWKIKLKK